MNGLLLMLLVVFIVAVLVWFWKQRGERRAEIEAHAAVAVTPNKVLLPEEEGQPDQHPRRPIEKQELRRRVVHGEYRATSDRGVATDVQQIERPS